MLSKTRYEHISLDEAGVPLIAGTTMKVEELVLEHLAHGWSPEELCYQHSYLTMGQIHSALAYYWDHQQQMDEEIQRGLAFVDELQRSLPLSPAVQRLRRARLA